jgi:hypothetical protein
VISQIRKRGIGYAPATANINNSQARTKVGKRHDRLIREADAATQSKACQPWQLLGNVCHSKISDVAAETQVQLPKVGEKPNAKGQGRCAKRTHLQ